MRRLSFFPKVQTTSLSSLGISNSNYLKFTIASCSTKNSNNNSNNSDDNNNNASSSNEEFSSEFERQEAHASKSYPSPKNPTISSHGIPLGQVPFQAPVMPGQRSRRMGPAGGAGGTPGSVPPPPSPSAAAASASASAAAGAGASPSQEPSSAAGSDGIAGEKAAFQRQQQEFQQEQEEQASGEKTTKSESDNKKKKPLVYGQAAQQLQRNQAKNEGRTPKAAKTDPEKPTSYKRSRDKFSAFTVNLERSFAGAASAREITQLEHIYYNYLRYFFTRETLIGKDRYGNRFTVRWFFLRERQEERRVYRVDKDKQHQPYGALATDSKLWESWMRKWRYDPPTPEEDEFARKRNRENLGVHVVGDEEVEDTAVRAMAHTKQASVALKELDNNDQYGKKFVMNTEQRAKEANPAKEHAGSWSAAVVRGDMFYNEEETEVLRNSLAHMFRDKEWQELELKRQVRLKKQKQPVRRPTVIKGQSADTVDLTDGEPMDHQWDRTDSGVPFGNGVSELTTPELEKLRAECDALEEERIALKKELGLTDVGDYREGRPMIDKGYDPFQPPPTSTRWKPKCWGENWGAGGGNLY